MEKETIDKLIEKMRQDYKAEIESKKADTNSDDENEIVYAEKYVRKSVPDTNEER